LNIFFFKKIKIKIEDYSLGKPEEYYYLNQSNVMAVQFYESLSFSKLKVLLLLLLLLLSNY